MNINTDEIFENSKKDMPTLQSNGLYLSVNQIEILNRYNIDYRKYTSLKQIIMEIEEYLNYEDDEDLENLSIELSDFYYYHNVNK